MRYIVSVKIQLTLCCPRCHGQSIKKNGTKRYGKQIYLCKDCNRQFIGNHNLTYIGYRSNIRHLAYVPFPLKHLIVSA